MHSVFYAVFAFLLFLITAAHAAPPPLLVVLLPGTTLSDWRKADAPTLNQLMASGALAVMNTRTARVASERVRETPDSALLTLGAGSRAAGNNVRFFPGTALVPGVGVPAKELYIRRMGRSPAFRAFLCPDWPRVQHDNAARGYDIPLGNLGDALQASGVTVNAQGHFARLLLSNGAGSFVQSPTPTLRVWDMGGDIVRADRLLHSLVMLSRASGGRIIVLSPFVNDRAYARGERLAPFLLWGEGVPAGLLYSPSTRQAGLILNTDFAPTVAAHFGARLPMPAFGRACTAQAASDAVLTVSLLQAGAYRQAALLRALPFCALLLGVSLLAGMLTRRRGWALVPLVLILTLAVSTSWYALPLWAAAFSLLAVLGRRRVGTARTVLLGSGLLTAVLIADMLTGSGLMRAGMLGYSAVEGARFYGIGNEAMGALVGAALVVAAHAGRRGGLQRLGVAGVLLGIVLLLGTAGAKAGGVLVGGVSFAALLWTQTGRRVSGRHVLVMATGALLLLLLLAGVDLVGSQHSHLGQALSRIADGGLPELWDIVRRKSATEARLLWHSTWAVPLWSSLLILWRGRRQNEPLRAAGSVAVVLCLLFNDAGVVAGALCGTLVCAGLAAERTKKARVLRKVLLPA